MADVNGSRWRKIKKEKMGQGDANLAVILPTKSVGRGNNQQSIIREICIKIPKRDSHAVK